MTVEKFIKHSLIDFLFVSDCDKLLIFTVKGFNFEAIKNLINFALTAVGVEDRLHIN